ncbi:MAG: hypothetical protein JWQ04_260 [Pedosphaera sp.]|nr:hypothetical protein [Pedosphaera sp.]
MFAGVCCFQKNTVFSEPEKFFFPYMPKGSFFCIWTPSSSRFPGKQLRQRVVNNGGDREMAGEWVAEEFDERGILRLRKVMSVRVRVYARAPAEVAVVPAKCARPSIARLGIVD